jgi:superfamily II DNA or RNA helicase
MTREQIRNDILNLKSKYILAELPTSVGKTRVALDFMHEKEVEGNILIVIPRLILIDNWKKEFIKWGYEPYLTQVTFTTYISLPKYTKGKIYDLVIFDECHHLSERAREAVEELVSNYTLLLSATVNRTLKKEFKMLFPRLECYRISMREAIDGDILPDPEVFLIPLELSSNIIETMVINPKAKKTMKASFPYRFMARKDKNTKYIIECTQQEYYSDLSAMVDFYKRNYLHTNNQAIYFRWQQKAKERLMWLSGLKNNVVLQLLEKLKDKRTLTFCNGIEQTEILGKYCINSKNTESDSILEDFNNEKINHITACNILNEGANLTNCQVGIFVSINSSDTMRIQKLGRILRHKEPKIFIIYYKDTREEELVKEMLENYNSELITVVDNFKQLNEINY